MFIMLFNIYLKEIQIKKKSRLVIQDKFYRLVLKYLNFIKCNISKNYIVRNITIFL